MLIWTRITCFACGIAGEIVYGYTVKPVGKLYDDAKRGGRKTKSRVSDTAKKVKR